MKSWWHQRDIGIRVPEGKSRGEVGEWTLRTGTVGGHCPLVRTSSRPGAGVGKLEDRSLERAGDREAGCWQDRPC